MVDALPRRPLPFGVFPLPFGYLLIPPGKDTEPIRESLLAGRLPKEWPERLQGHHLALSGDLAGAAVCFAGDDPVSRFNRYVLDPDGGDAADLRDALGEELGVLVDVVDVALGRDDVSPETGRHDSELAALVLASQAALRLEADDVEAAAARLVDAIDAALPVFPALAGLLHGAAASACRRGGDDDEALEHVASALDLLATTDLSLAQAELHLEAGTIYHEQATERVELLHRAVYHYHCALQLISEQQAPELFASAHANLATAYLTMPMVEASDHLRYGVAVGSLRAALKVYSKESHPAQWSSAQLNLANALVYAPTTHPADNLVEAVELYESVLAVRDRNVDPLGYARVSANQGNVLAHLGMFEEARGKLVEARFIFEEFHEYDAVTSVRGLLDEIARQRTVVDAEV